MKKIVKLVISIVVVLFCAWFILSWIDVIADNSRSNPQHCKYNMFTLVTQEKQEMETNKIDTSVKHATIYSIDGNYITFETDDGNLWVIEDNNSDGFNADSHYYLFFQGAEISRVWEEH